MRIKVMFAALAIVLGIFGTATADNVYDNFIGFGTIENCSYGVSIDGDYAAVVDDNGEYALYLYHFPTRTLQPVDTRTDIRVYGASLSGTKIAYIYSVGWSGGKNISIYDMVTGEITETGITTADRWDSYRPMRFFDGERITFTEGYGSTIKYYTLSNGQVTDTGLDGWDPIIDGDIIAFTARGDGNVHNAAIYNIQAGETTILEPGYGTVVAGNVVAYIASDRSWRVGEVKYYLLNSGTIHATGLSNTEVMSTDGRRIAVAPEFGSIKLFDLATGEIEDTGEWPCTGGWPCWLAIDGEYIAYERWEGGADYRTPDGTYIEIYPETDYNSDGWTGSDCPGGWFVSAIKPLPVSAIGVLMEELSNLDISAGIKNSLHAKLAVARKKLLDSNESNDDAATNLLEAFLNAVDAQEGVHISSQDAAYLRDSVSAILLTL